MSKSPNRISMSAASDLHFHTQAADQISDELAHSKYYREKFAKRLFEAIHAGEITAYSHRDGSELLHPIAKARPLCVKVVEVNSWLKNNSYDAQWKPDQHVKQEMDGRGGSGVEKSGAPLNYRLLATRQGLIDVFGKFTGMDRSWFRCLKDAPALLAARRVKGRGMRHSVEPWFCPYSVMCWLIDPKRRRGRKLSQDKGWDLLEKNFPDAYVKVSTVDPR